MVSVCAIRFLRFFSNYCLFSGKKLEQEQVESEQERGRGWRERSGEMIPMSADYRVTD
jgi:hypothetical protein